MGKTKIKTIDDSAPAEEAKKEKPQEVKAAEVAKPEAPIPTPPNLPKSPKSSKPGKAKPRSKKYQEITKDLDRSKTYPLSEAIDMVKKLNYAKFNATLEAHINTVQTGIRGLISLPFASGKKLRILVFGRLPSPEENEGVALGDDYTIEEINKGKVDFDLVITTPDWMSKLAKVARVLGPRGLMPNPKNGTITSGEDGLKKAVEGFQAGKTEYEHSSKQVYKTESKAPVIHIGLGKLNQPTEELSANVKTLLQTIGKTRVKKVTLSPTMGPGVKVDLGSIQVYNSQNNTLIPTA